MLLRGLVTRALLLALLSLACAAQTLPPFSAGNRGFRDGRLRGTVASADGAPLGNVRIEIQDLSNGSTVASTYSSPVGVFEVEHLPHGIFEVVASLGTSEAHERLEIGFGDAEVHFNMPHVHGPDNRTGAISVSSLLVPDKAKSHFRKAQELVDKHKLDEARNRLEKALELYSNYADALTLRGILNLEDKKLDLASTDLERAIQIDPNHPLAYLALGSTYNAGGRYKDALRVLDRSLMLAPNSWQARFEMAKAYLGAGDFAAALRHADKALAQAPKQFSVVHLVKAHALLGVKDYTGALGEMEAYVSNTPNGPDRVQAERELAAVKAFTSRK